MSVISDIVTELRNIKTSIITALGNKGVTSSGQWENFGNEINGINANIPSFFSFDANNLTDYQKNQFLENFKQSGLASKISDVYSLKGTSSLPTWFFGDIDKKNTSLVGFYEKNIDVAHLDTPFYNCTSLKKLPDEINLNNATTIYGLFHNCTALTKIPNINAPLATYVSSLITDCSNVTEIGIIHAPNAKTLTRIFSGCTNIRSIKGLNVGKPTNVEELFRFCENLTTVPLFDTSDATNMNAMFFNCRNLITIPQFNAKSATSLTNAFYCCYKLQTLDMYGMRVSFDLSYCAELSTAEINKIFNNCGQAESGATITLPNTDAAKAANNNITTAKGWTIAYV